MSFDAQKHKCDSCGLYLEFSNFSKNKAKTSGLNNKCKDCMYEYKQRGRHSTPLPTPLVPRLFYFVPNIFLVGVGRCQTYQNCCLHCEKPFFCMIDIKEAEDLFCDNCSGRDFMIPEQNISPVNFVGHVIGWIEKVETASKKRTQRNYKKVYQRDKYTCQYCYYNLKDAKKFLPLHIDHIKPWSSSGGNAMSNLVVACQECNLLVSNKWFKTFEDKKRFILSERIRRPNRYQSSQI